MPAISISTSAVARVWYSGFIAGPATVVTASIEPDSGVTSTHDSRNEWSGRIRSARLLVSSMKLPKLTMKGIFSSASRTFSAFGDPYTGFASSRSNTLADCKHGGEGLGAGG